MDGKQPVKEVTGPPFITWLYSFVLSMSVLTCSLFIYSISGSIRFIAIKYKLSPLLQGLTLAAPLLASIVSTLFIVPMSDIFGRRLSLMACMLIVAAGSIVSGVAPNWAVLLAGRLVGGVGCGAALAARLYGSEISTPACRQRQMNLQSIGASVGLFLGLSSAFFTLRLNHFRVPLFMPTIAAVCSFVLIISVLPESPRWLLSKGQFEEANNGIRTIYGTDAHSHLTCEQTREPETVESWRDLNQNKYWRPILRVLLLNILIKIPSFVFIGLYLLLEVEVLFGRLANWADSIIPLSFGLVHVLLVTLCWLLSTRRQMHRLLLTFGLLGYGAVLLMTGVSFYFIHKHSLLPPLTLVFMSVCAASYSLISPIASIVTWESLPIEIRGRGAAFAHSMSQVVSFVLFLTYPLMLSVKSMPTRLVFCILFSCSALVALLSAAIFKSMSSLDEKIIEQIDAIHRLPVLPPDGENRSEILKAEGMGDLDSIINLQEMKAVKIILPPPTPP